MLVSTQLGWNVSAEMYVLKKVVGAERVANTAAVNGDNALAGGEEIRVSEDVVAGEEQCQMPVASECMTKSLWHVNG